MQIQELNMNQLSPDEISLISNELGIPKQEVINGSTQNPTFTPQYNPYQSIQPNPYTQYNQYYNYQNLYYQYPNYQYPYQTQCYNYQNPYYQYPNMYSYQNPYYQQQNSCYPQYYQQPQQYDSKAYEQQVYMDNKFMYNPYYSYIKMAANYDPNKQNTYNTYFGYSPYGYNSASQYGFNPTNEQISNYGGVNEFVKSQYDIFMKISKGVSSLENKLSENQIIDHYKNETKMPDPIDFEKESGVTFNRIIYTPEQQKINNNQMHIEQIAISSERYNQICKYNKMIADKAREEFIRKQKEKLPDTTTLAQFLKVGGQLYAEALYDEYVQKSRRNMTNSYDQNKFNNFVNGNINQGYFGNIYRPVTDINDITITLPDHLKNNYDRRRDKFIEAIINKTM